jgi:hypothetical protein
MDMQKTAGELLTGIEGRLQDDGETPAVCIRDGWPTGLRCTCGHGHGRHSGNQGEARCMSYVGQGDCNCRRFRPAQRGVVRLYRDAVAMAAVLRELEQAHVKRTENVHGSGCRECGQLWPCATVLAMEGGLP